MAIAPPDFAAFCTAYESGGNALLWRHEVADLLTPVAAFLKLGHGRPYAFLLESVEGGTARGRYSVIGLDPDLIWRVDRGSAAINRDAQTGTTYTPLTAAPLDSLRALIAETALPVPEGLPPMVGGLSGYLGYDMVRLMERLPDVNPDVLGIPDAILVRPSLFVIFDGVTDELTLAAPVYPRPDRSAAAAYEAAQSRLSQAAAALEQPVPKLRAAGKQPAPIATANMTKPAFLAMVDRAKDYIRAGDVFQVVPSQRFAVPFTLPPFALYRSLRRINPAPFLFYLDFADFQAVGSSPEILVRLRDGTVTIRPLAGTRRRGATRAEDQALEDELLADPKERAEHLMLLDLGRNDVGRVAETGSVKVVESFAIERFSHVMHISSTVEGRLRPGLDALDALIAGFPAGTLSGAPKVRAMQIIDELEPSRRGLYAGCIGYFAGNGTMDTCIGLRTAVVKNGTMYVQAGVGVVVDSVPEDEYAESLQKARALLRAAEDAVRYAEQHT